MISSAFPLETGKLSAYKLAPLQDSPVFAEAQPDSSFVFLALGKALILVVVEVERASRMTATRILADQE